MEALYVLKTLAVRPGMSELRCLFSMLVCNERRQTERRLRDGGAITNPDAGEHLGHWVALQRRAAAAGGGLLCKKKKKKPGTKKEKCVKQWRRLHYRRHPLKQD